MISGFEFGSIGGSHFVISKLVVDVGLVGFAVLASHLSLLAILVCSIQEATAVVLLVMILLGVVILVIAFLDGVELAYSHNEVLQHCLENLQ